MEIGSRETTSQKLLAQSPNIILSYDNKINKKKSSKFEISSSKDNNIQKLNNKNEIEKEEEEYGYELDQSQYNEDYLNNIKENKNKASLSLHEKSNGDICLTNITNNNFDKKQIKIENNNDNISLYKFLYNNNKSGIDTEIKNQKNIIYESGLASLDGDQTNINNKNKNKDLINETIENYIKKNNIDLLLYENKNL